MPVSGLSTWHSAAGLPKLALNIQFSTLGNAVVFALHSVQDMLPSFVIGMFEA